MFFEIKNIKASYSEGIEVLHDISLIINKGEIVVIVGGNGAGKTTLLLTISGLLDNKFGEIKYKDRNIEKMKPHEIVELGIVQVPEGRLLFADMTVKENLELGGVTCRAKNVRSETMDEVLQLFPTLKKKLNQKAGRLSGGESQMCAIGRGLMSRPELFLLDEPSLGLAPIVVKGLFAMVQKLNNKGITVLLVEQNVKQSLEIGDRAYVLENGRFIIEGNSKDLISDRRIIDSYLGLQ